MPQMFKERIRGAAKEKEEKKEGEKEMNRYSWIQCFPPNDGYYIFEDRIYRVGKELRFPELADYQQKCNFFCKTRFADDTNIICDLLNNEMRKK